MREPHQTCGRHHHGRRRGHPDEVHDPQGPAPDRGSEPRRRTHSWPPGPPRPSTWSSSCGTGATRSPRTWRRSTPRRSSPTRTRSRAPAGPTECALDALPADLIGTVLVTYGDVPLLAGRDAASTSSRSTPRRGSAVTVVTARVPDPTGYGRILRDEAGAVQGIVEQKDATEEQRAITEINSGIYAFDVATLRAALARSAPTTPRARSTSPTSSPSPVTRAGPCVRTSSTTSGRPRASTTASSSPRLGKELNRRTSSGGCGPGVTVVDPGTTWMDADGDHRPGRVILPGHPAARRHHHRCGGRRSAPTRPSPTPRSATGAEVKRTEANLAVIGEEATVGPFSYLRPGTDLGAQGQDRRFRRDQERPDRRRRQGPAPVVCR